MTHSTRGRTGAAEETRQRLLEAGAELLLERGLPSGLNIKIADACRRIDRTSGSAYQVWPTQADYQRDLAVYVARKVDYAGTQLLDKVVTDALRQTDDDIGLIRSMAELYFADLVKNEFFYLSLAFWSTPLDGTDAISEAIRAGYTEIQTQFEGFFEAYLEMFGRAMRPPWTVRRMTMAATGLTEGLALRYRVAENDAERDELVSLYGDLFSSLAETMAPRV